MLPSWFRSINLLAVDGCFADPRLNGTIYLTREICDTTLMSFGHRKLAGSLRISTGTFTGCLPAQKDGEACCQDINPFSFTVTHIP